MTDGQNRKYHAAYREKNREKMREYHRAWVKNNPGRTQQSRVNNFAKRMGAEGSHTLEEWKKISESGLCSYCGKPCKPTRDHFIPIARGGRNDIYNIVPACLPCNTSKGTKNPEEVAQWLADRTIEQIRSDLCQT